MFLAHLHLPCALHCMHTGPERARRAWATSMSGAFNGRGPARRNRAEVAPSASISRFFSAVAAVPAQQVAPSELHRTASPSSLDGIASNDLPLAIDAQAAAEKRRRAVALARRRALAWFFGEPPEGACPVCHEEPDMVVQLACGHSLCRNCMRSRVAQRSTGRSCSECGDSSCALGSSCGWEAPARARFAKGVRSRYGCGSKGGAERALR